MAKLDKKPSQFKSNDSSNDTDDSTAPDKEVKTQGGDGTQTDGADDTAPATKKPFGGKDDSGQTKGSDDKDGDPSAGQSDQTDDQANGAQNDTNGDGGDNGTSQSQFVTLKDLRAIINMKNGEVTKPNGMTDTGEQASIINTKPKVT